jgi:hypothetical protein
MKLDTNAEFISTKEKGAAVTHTCEKCNKFRCPLVMKYSNVIGCDRDIMEQTWASKKGKSRDFEEVAKELGI